jgi:hypothetical protein
MQALRRLKRLKLNIGPILYTIIFPEQVVQNIIDFNTKKL